MHVCVWFFLWRPVAKCSAASMLYIYTYMILRVCEEIQPTVLFSELLLQFVFHTCTSGILCQLTLTSVDYLLIHSLSQRQHTRGILENR
jgi:hypothetical protein